MEIKGIVISILINYEIFDVMISLLENIFGKNTLKINIGSFVTVINMQN